MMAELQHPNIVRLFGVVLAPPMLVLEYCSGSDLRHLLDERAVEVRAACLSICLSVCLFVALELRLQ